MKSALDYIEKIHIYVVKNDEFWKVDNKCRNLLEAFAFIEEECEPGEYHIYDAMDTRVGVQKDIDGNTYQTYIERF